MKVKILEIRDVGTFIAALCVDMNPDNDKQRYLLRRYGYPCDGRPNIVITHAEAWANAHNYIIEHWYELKDGDVVDVEFILGESDRPKTSERETVPL
jgi:hypothetical protein